MRDLADRVTDARIVYPVHPNPNVTGPARELLADHPRIALTDPLDYFDLVAALRHASLVLTDSGGIQEEAPTFGAPVLVLRDVTERPEGIEAGVAELVGTDRNRIVERALAALASPAGRRPGEPVRRRQGGGAHRGHPGVGPHRATARPRRTGVREDPDALRLLPARGGRAGEPHPFPVPCARRAGSRGRRGHVALAAGPSAPRGRWTACAYGAHGCRRATPFGWAAHALFSMPRFASLASSADVLHAQDIAAVLPCMLAQRVRNAPIVTTYHTSHFLARASSPVWRPIFRSFLDGGRLQPRRQRGDRVGRREHRSGCPSGGGHERRRHLGLQAREAHVARASIRTASPRRAEAPLPQERCGALRARASRDPSRGRRGGRRDRRRTRAGTRSSGSRPSSASRIGSSSWGRARTPRCPGCFPRATSPCFLRSWKPRRSRRSSPWRAGSPSRRPASGACPRSSTTRSGRSSRPATPERWPARWSTSSAVGGSRSWEPRRADASWSAGATSVSRTGTWRSTSDAIARRRAA